jgi:hypothetical protein
MGHIRAILAAALLTASVASGLALTSILQQHAVSTAYAECEDNLVACINDLTRTSSLLVSHAVQDGMNLYPVEPDTGEDWTVSALYASKFNITGCSCVTEVYEAEVTVTWSESTATWTATCN